MSTSETKIRNQSLSLQYLKFIWRYHVSKYWSAAFKLQMCRLKRRLSLLRTISVLGIVFEKTREVRSESKHFSRQSKTIGPRTDEIKISTNCISRLWDIYEYHDMCFFWGKLTPWGSNAACMTGLNCKIILIITTHVKKLWDSIFMIKLLISGWVQKLKHW